MTLLLPYGPYAGVNGSLLRMAAAKLADMNSASLYDLSVVLGVSPDAAKPTWDHLVSEGFIHRTSEGDRPTARMDDLAGARFGKPLARKRADALLEKAVNAAKALNSLPSDAPYFWVTRLAVFGSYLDHQKTELGDLDVAWEVAMRPGVEKLVRRAIINNRDELQSTRAKIFPKGPFVRWARFSELLALECPYRVIYTFQSDDLAKALADEGRRRREAIELGADIDRMIKEALTKS